MTKAMNNPGIASMIRHGVAHAAAGTIDLVDNVMKLSSRVYTSPERYKLEVDRIFKRLPLMLHTEDSRTNHVHADDLGRACIAALGRGRANRVYNVSDDSSLAMGEWFDALADAFALPRAPRLPREEVRRAVPPLQWSFMNESRRLDNTRMKTELRLRLRYPTVAAGISAALMEEASSCSG